MGRLEVDEYFIEIAKLVARRATCSRRQVGCVLVNTHNHVIATGYNGVAAGVPHCIDAPCPGAGYASGTGLHMCQAIHAEQNALIQCRDISQITTAYVTVSPCVSCLRLLLNTSCRRIVFAEEYPHVESRQMWTSVGREWVYFKGEKPEPVQLTPISQPADDLVQLQFHLPATTVQALNRIGTDRLVQKLKEEAIRLAYFSNGRL